MKPELIVMVGIPGSGKSTYVTELAEQGYAIINPDNIRVEITGDMADQSRNAEVWREANGRLLRLLGEGRNVVLDATNVDPVRRKELLDMVRESGVDVDIKAYVKPVDKDEAIRRVKGRASQGGLDVPEEVMDRMHNSFTETPPSLDEGFSEIRRLSSIADHLESMNMYKEATLVDIVTGSLKKSIQA